MCRRGVAWWWSLGLAALAVVSPARAQQHIDRSVNPAAVTVTVSDAERALRAAAETPAEKTDQKPGDGKADTASILPNVWCGNIDDQETKAVCWKAYRASLHYYETGLTHRSRVFQWQHLSTVITFFTVLALVATGIFFAWLQFTRDRTVATQTLELSTTGLKLSSNFLGVVILALSLGFFYLYMVYVYPIHELF